MSLPSSRTAFAFLFTAIRFQLGHFVIHVNDAPVALTFILHTPNRPHENILMWIKCFPLILIWMFFVSVYIFRRPLRATWHGWMINFQTDWETDTMAVQKYEKVAFDLEITVLNRNKNYPLQAKFMLSQWEWRGFEMPKQFMFCSNWEFTKIGNRSRTEKIKQRLNIEAKHLNKLYSSVVWATTNRTVSSDIFISRKSCVPSERMPDATTSRTIKVRAAECEQRGTE